MKTDGLYSYSVYHRPANLGKILNILLFNNVDLFSFETSEQPGLEWHEYKLFFLLQKITMCNFFVLNKIYLCNN